MSPSVLIAWELGGGYGHHYRISALADACRRVGAAPVIAAAGGRRRLEPVAHDHPVIEAPVMVPPPRRFPLSLSYAGNLLRNGWWHSDTLTGAVRGWLDLFEKTCPDRVIAEHAPAAVVAARIAGLPCTMVGTGFTVPPQASPLPSLHPWLAVPTPVLQRTERDFLDAISPLCAMYGFAPPQTAADLFRHADRLACCDPETDHYAAARRSSWIGPVLESATGVAAATSPEIFVYLKAGNRFLEPMLAAVAATGRPALAHIPGMQPADRARHASATLTISEQPVDLSTVAPSCRLAVTDGGFNTAAFFLAAGVPLLCCPGWLEQACLAWQLATRGLARTFNFTTAAPHCAEGLAAALADDAMAEAVKAFASRRPPRNVAADIAARVLRAVPAADRIAAHA